MTEHELRAIYASIPTVRQCENCHDCAIRCSGAIKVAACEWLAIRDHIERHIPPSTLQRLLTEDKTFEIADEIRERFCILYDMSSRRCAVYPVRPLVCRLLGHVEFMPCPMGRIERVLVDGPGIMQRYAEMDLRTFSDWSTLAPSAVVARALSDGEEGSACLWSQLSGGSKRP